VTDRKITVIPPVDPDEVRAQLPAYLRDRVQRRPARQQMAGRGRDVNYEDARQK
jgi:hypothetical protein